MATLYATPGTRRQLELAGLNPALDTFDGNLAVVTHPDALGPDGKISEPALRKNMKAFGENVQSVTQYSEQVAYGLEYENYNQALSYTPEDLRTTDGQDLCLVAGNLTYQDKAGLFSYISGVPEDQLNKEAIPGTSKDWSTMWTLHELGHCEKRDQENNIFGFIAEPRADRHALAEFADLAKNPDNGLNSDVPEAFLDARILGSAFIGADPKSKADAFDTAGALVLGKVEGHDTYLSAAYGDRYDQANAAAARANTLIYSMAPQTEAVRLGGMDYFNQEHPEMAGNVAKTPAQAFDQAGKLMDVQKDQTLLNQTKDSSLVDAGRNAVNGAVLVNKDPKLAYASAQAVLDNGMVTKGSLEETYIQDYITATDKYVPSRADKDLAAEASANFDNTVSKDAIAASNEKYFAPDPKLSPEQPSVPASTPQPAQLEKTPEAPAPTYNASLQAPAPSFG